METIDDILREMNDAAHLAPWAVENDGHLLTDWFYDDECQGWLAHYANRIEEAAKWIVRGLNDGIVARDKYIAKLTNENARLKAAIQPVLDIVMDSATSDLSMELAINEAKRIYNEGER